MARSRTRSDTFNDAFDGLFADAYAAALDVLGDEQEAEDIAVEATARAYARWSRLERHSWRGNRVILTALELALDVVDRSGTVTGSDDGEGDGEAGGDGAEIAAHDEEIVAIAALPRREREVIALRDLAGLSIEECAAVLRASEQTVARLSDRGRARLRGQAGAGSGDGDGDGAGGEATDLPIDVEADVEAEGDDQVTSHG